MKRILSFISALILLAAALSGCGEKAQPQLRTTYMDPGKIVQISATDSVFSSYMYIIEDETAIWELVDMYNKLTYEELADGEEAPELLTGTLYSFTFCKKDGSEEPEDYASIAISPQGYLVFPTTDYGHAYRLTCDFDEAHIKKLLEDYNTFK